MQLEFGFLWRRCGETGGFIPAQSPEVLFVSASLFQPESFSSALFEGCFIFSILQQQFFFFYNASFSLTYSKIHSLAEDR
jgi:hypothetical protein